MLDIKKEIKNKRIFKLERRGVKLDVNHINKIISERRLLHDYVDEIRHFIKEKSSEVNKNTVDKNKIQEISKEIREKKKLLEKTEEKKRIIDDEYNYIAMRFPNIPDDDIPEGESDLDNVEIFAKHDKKNLNFTPKNHIELNEKIKIFDFVRGAKVAGRGNVFYVDKGAILELALIRYMTDWHIRDNRTIYLTPLIVNKESCECTAQLPKFEEDFFKTKDDDYLISTSEISLVSMFRNEILDLDSPIRSACPSPCFRREAGSAGVNDRGIIRTHQFNKVEMVSICKEEHSEEEFASMIKTVKEILDTLNIPYRVLNLCAGDLSFAAKKTWDIEVWLPGQDRYYECSSVSHCGDFQARRGKIRYRNKEGKIMLANTLNGSGIATSRLMVALLENNQDDRGNISIPSVLWKYTGFKKISAV